MRIAVDTVGLPVTDGLAEAMGRVVDERVSSPLFASVRDLRLRFRNVQGALLCIAAVGLTGGGLATSTATGADAIEAAAGALDALPGRIDRVRPPALDASIAAASDHASFRAQVEMRLDRA